jgi:hypothetical protein
MDRDNLEDTDVKGRIGSSWLSIETGEYGNEPSGSIKRREFLDKLKTG